MSFRQLLPGYDIGFLDKGGIERSFALTRPPLQLRQLIDKEYACALRLATWLHNPCALWILPVLFHEHVVVCISSEQKVKYQMIYSTSRFIEEAYNKISRNTSLRTQVIHMIHDVTGKKVK